MVLGVYFCTTNVKLMFFKGIKIKSAQKYIANNLKTIVTPANGKIISLAVLVDGTKYEEFPFLNEISTVFGIRPESITVLYYHSDKKLTQQFPETMFTDADLGFSGVLKNESVSKFINKTYDGLLSFYKEDILLLNLVAVQSKAKFKIGFSGTNEAINDLSIATELDDITTFTFELKKYLSILNKI